MFTAPRWFQKELRLISPELHTEWLPQAQRWGIYQGKVLNRVVENKDHEYKDLDQRTLRKLRLDFFFTLNPKALDAYREKDPYVARAYMERGLDGVKNYLQGEYLW